MASAMSQVTTVIKTKSSAATANTMSHHFEMKGPPLAILGGVESVHPSANVHFGLFPCDQNLAIISFFAPQMADPVVTLGTQKGTPRSLTQGLPKGDTLLGGQG